MYKYIHTTFYAHNVHTASYHTYTQLYTHMHHIHSFIYALRLNTRTISDTLSLMISRTKTHTRIHAPHTYMYTHIHATFYTHNVHTASYAHTEVSDHVKR